MRNNLSNPRRRLAPEWVGWQLARFFEEGDFAMIREKRDELLKKVERWEVERLADALERCKALRSNVRDVQMREQYIRHDEDVALVLPYLDA